MFSEIERWRKSRFRSKWHFHEFRQKTGIFEILIIVLSRMLQNLKTLVLGGFTKTPPVLRRNFTRKKLYLPPFVVLCRNMGGSFWKQKCYIIKFSLLKHNNSQVWDNNLHLLFAFGFFVQKTENARSSRDAFEG